MQSFINFPVGSPEYRQQQMKQQIMAGIMGGGQSATPAQGMASGFGSIMNGLALRKMNTGAFPDAPGGAKPSFPVGLMNFFGIQKGGLY